MKNQRLILLTLFIPFLFACGKNGDGPDPYNNPGSLTPSSSTVGLSAVIDGVPWEATGVLAAHTYFAQGNITQYTFKGENDTEEFIQVAMQWTKNEQFDPGTYEIGGYGGELAVTVIMNRNNKNYSMVTLQNPTGFVKIDQNSGSTTKGSFEALMTDFAGDTIAITNGQYKTDNMRPI